MLHAPPAVVVSGALGGIPMKLKRFLVLFLLAAVPLVLAGEGKGCTHEGEISIEIDPAPDPGPDPQPTPEPGTPDPGGAFSIQGIKGKAGAKWKSAPPQEPTALTAGDIKGTLLPLLAAGGLPAGTATHSGAIELQSLSLAFGAVFGDGAFQLEQDLLVDLGTPVPTPAGVQCSLRSRLGEAQLRELERVLAGVPDDLAARTELVAEFTFRTEAPDGLNGGVLLDVDFDLSVFGLTEELNVRELLEETVLVKVGAAGDDGELRAEVRVLFDRLEAGDFAGALEVLDDEVLEEGDLARFATDLVPVRDFLAQFFGEGTGDDGGDDDD